MKFGPRGPGSGPMGPGPMGPKGATATAAEEFLGTPSRPRIQHPVRATPHSDVNHGGLHGQIYIGNRKWSGIFTSFLLLRLGPDQR